MFGFFQIGGDPAFVPHGYCLSWNPQLVWLHVVSDSLIALSYFSIPVALLYFALHRRDAAYTGVLLLFAAFIVACGMTHVLAVYTLWQPAYWLDGMVKALTAMVSIACAVLLWPLVPKAIALPSRVVLEQEMLVRQRAVADLRNSNRELEATKARLEAEIAERRNTDLRFQQIFELAPHATVIVDGQGVIQLANAQLLNWFGHTRESLVGQPIEVLIPERFRAGHPQMRAGYMQGPTQRPMGTGRALFGLRKDGTEFPVDISLSPLPGMPEPQVLAAIVDMTDRVRTEQALRQSNASLDLINRELETFAYSVSHDLRQPVRALTGFTQILLEDYWDKLDAEGQDHLRRIQRAGERMGQMIEALLGLSRISRGTLSRSRQDLSALALEVLEEIRQTQPGREPEIVVAPQLEADADPRLLRLLLQNLLGNAWKFSAQAATPRIEMGRTSSGGDPVFFIRDNGAGFDMAYADKLFGAFQRLHQADEFPGTGIGLATAQRIVIRHGGRIWAEGKVGAGAAFYFTLSVRGPS